MTYKGVQVLQWDRVENKTAVAVYGAGAVVLLWFSSTIVSAVNSVPLVSKAAHDIQRPSLLSNCHQQCSSK